MFVVIFAEQVIVGAVASFTVTVKVQVLLLPLLSLAVQFTVVNPRLKVEPLGGTQVRLVTAQLSVAVTVKFTTWLQVPAAVLVVTFPEQVRAGAAASFTVTVKLQLLLFPLASCVVQVMVVVPRIKAVPLGGRQVTLVKVQLSVALVG